MKKIVIASNNAGKLREIRAILAPFGLDAVSQKEAGFDAEVEETGTTFAENAALKAHAVHEALHCAVIADDSGLLVDALDGAPGVYSHRFAGENATAPITNVRIKKDRCPSLRADAAYRVRRTLRIVPLCRLSGAGGSER